MTGNWLYSIQDGATHYFNLELVRHMEERPDSIKVIFAPDHSLIFEGPAKEAVKHVLREKGFTI